LLSKIQSLGCRGVTGYAVSVECHVSNGLPGFDIVGLPDAAVKEARERVRSAIKTNGMKFPVSRLTVNLAPADTRKAGTLYDLPVLLGILCATGEIRQPPATAAFLGEVSLAGDIRPVTGALTMALAAEQIGLKELYVPAGNAAEAAFADRVTVYPVENIAQLVHHLRGDRRIAPKTAPRLETEPLPGRFCRGQGAGERQARARGGRRRRAQHPAHRPAGRGQVHARQAPADHSARDEPRRNDRDHAGLFRPRPHDAG